MSAPVSFPPAAGSPLRQRSPILGVTFRNLLSRTFLEREAGVEGSCSEEGEMTLNPSRRSPPSAKPEASQQDESVTDSLDEELWFGDVNPTRSNSKASESLAAAAAKAAGLKPFPVVAGEVLRLLSDPDFDRRTVMQTIERDPAIATRLLRVANSALFRASTACNSIEAAILRLGAQTVSELVVGIAAMAMFDDSSGVGKRFRDHCANVAALTRVLGANWRFRGVPQLFLCGLLHDVGKLLTMQCGEFNYANLPPEILETPDQVHIAERKALGYDHAVLAAHVLDLWKIPYPVSPVVAFHHQPGRAYEDSREIGLMVAMLRLADRIEYRLQRDTAMDEEFIEELVRDGACSFADISSGDLRMMWEDMVTARREIAGMLGIQ